MEEINELIEKIGNIRLQKYDRIYSQDENLIETDIIQIKKIIKNLETILSSDHIIKNGYKYKRRDWLINHIHLITYFITALIITILFTTLIDFTESLVFMYFASLVVCIPLTSMVNFYKKRMLKENKLLKPYYDVYGSKKEKKEIIEKNLNKYKVILEEKINSINKINKDKETIKELDKLLNKLNNLSNNNKYKIEILESIKEELNNIINNQDKNKVIKK